MDFNFKNPLGDVNKMKKKIGKTIKFEDGSYTGIITGTEEKQIGEYDYFYIYIKEEKTGITLNCSVPSTITENTALGKILKNFGATELKEETEIDTENFIKKDMKVTFLIKNEGNFAQIVKDTLKPIK